MAGGWDWEDRPTHHDGAVLGSVEDPAGTHAAEGRVQLVRDLANYKASDPKCGITQMHVYPLGGMKKSAAWSYAVADGDFTLDPKGKGFKVDRSID